MRSDKILDSNVMHISKPILIFSAERWKTNIMIEISNIDLPNWGQKISKKWKSIFPQKSHKGPPFGFYACGKFTTCKAYMLRKNFYQMKKHNENLLNSFRSVSS